MSKQRRSILSMMAAVVFAVALCPGVVYADEAPDAALVASGGLTTQDGNIASGTWGTCPWEISADGVLTVHPGKGDGHGTEQGIGAIPIGTDRSYWFEYADSVKSVVFSSEGGEMVVPGDASCLLAGLKGVESVDLSGLDLSESESTYGMFYGLSVRTLDLSMLDLSSVKNMESMFDGCKKLESVDLTGVDTSNVTDMHDMFGHCSSLKSIDLSTLDTHNVTDMRYLFDCCTSLVSVNLKGLDTSKVTTMKGMFADCRALPAIDLSDLDTSSLTDMQAMFCRCLSLETLDLSGLDTSKVTNMNSLLCMWDLGAGFGSSSLKSVNLSGLDTSCVTTMGSMFSYCVSLETLDLSSFDTSNVTDVDRMFEACSALGTITAGPLWSMNNVADPEYMFYGCTSLVGGDGTTYDEAHIDAEYARVDAEGAPGYLTAAADPGEPGDPGESGASEPAEKPKTELKVYKGEARKAGFTDLVASAWYLNDGGKFPGTDTLYLDYTIARGLMSGYTGARKGQFGPDDDLSRGMAATIIYRMATGKTAETTDNDVDTPFSDVSRGAWYAAAVKWCAENSVVTGYSGTDRFGPEDPITREQLATVIGRYMDPEAEAGEDVSQFRDAAAISDFAKVGIAYCNKQGIMTGIGDSGNFNPGGSATRCQMAKVIAVTARMAE